MNQPLHDSSVEMRIELYLSPATYRALKAKAEPANLTAGEYIALLIDRDLRVGHH